MDSYAIRRISDMLDFCDKSFTGLSVKHRSFVLDSLLHYQKKIENYRGDDKYHFGNLYTTVEQKIELVLAENTDK